MLAVSSAAEEDKASHLPRSSARSGFDREQALELYVRGEITVDELVDVMDRQGNWVERLIRRFSAHPASVERFSTSARRMRP